MKIVYTLDKLVVMLRTRYDAISHVFDVLDGASGEYGLIKKQWLGYLPSTMHYNYSVELDCGESYYIGWGVYGAAPSQHWITVKLEFNPAKVGRELQFTELYNYLMYHTKYIDFRRFDVAIDIPLPRSRFRLLKDQRKYALIEYSAENKTEYLGVRSSHGQVKLYNKQLESKLPYPLTRLEITMDYEKSSWIEFQRVFPDVLTVPPEGVFDLDVTGTDKVLLVACMEHPDLLMELPQIKRKKIRTLLATTSEPMINPSEIDYKVILQQILEYGKYETVQDFAEIDSESEDVFRAEIAVTEEKF